MSISRIYHSPAGEPRAKKGEKNSIISPFLLFCFLFHFQKSGTKPNFYKVLNNSV